MTSIQKITNWQLHIPQEIRDALQWPKKGIQVKIETTEKGFKVEQVSPEEKEQKKKKLTKKQWDKIYDNMRRISKMGKQGVNLTEFLRHDRDTHF